MGNFFAGHRQPQESHCL